MTAAGKRVAGWPWGRVQDCASDERQVVSDESPRGTCSSASDSRGSGRRPPDARRWSTHLARARVGDGRTGCRLYPRSATTYSLLGTWGFCENTPHRARASREARSWVKGTGLTLSAGVWQGGWELSSPALCYSSWMASQSLGFKTGSSSTWGAVLPSDFPSQQPLLQTKRRGSCSAKSETTAPFTRLRGRRRGAGRDEVAEPALRPRLSGTPGSREREFPGGEGQALAAGAVPGVDLLSARKAQ